MAGLSPAAAPPPLSLDLLYLCDEADVRFFSGNRRFGYFRHVLRAADLPIGELLAAHLQQVGSAHHNMAENGPAGQCRKLSSCSGMIITFS